MLIQQLCTSHQASADRFYRTLYESLLDARLITSSKQSLYLNLLYRALKADMNVKRVKAFAKRILQTLTLHQPSFICGCFFLLQELRETFPGLSGLIDQSEEHGQDEEVYDDVRDPDENLIEANKPQEPRKQNHAYDSRKRDPEYSNAENSCLWEVVPFLVHFHPSVAVSAEYVIRHAKLPGKPDLEIHTLIHFLDRFVYRNAKIGVSKLRGSSIMQPLAGGDNAGLLVTSSSQDQLPVNSEQFWARKSEVVAAQDVFFHQYFNNLSKPKQVNKTTKNRKSADEDMSGDEESEIWQAMMDSAPDLKGAEDSDEGLEMSDLESSFEATSDDDGEAAVDEAEPSDTESFADLETSLAEDGGVSTSNTDEKQVVGSKQDNSRRKTGRKELKRLPTFASVSDYAKMIDDEEGEDLG
jgi:ribosome biogenesis protein MAK21